MYGILNVRRIRERDFGKIEDRFATVFKRIKENPNLSPEEQDEKIADILGHCTGPEPLNIISFNHTEVNGIANETARIIPKT